MSDPENPKPPNPAPHGSRQLPFLPRKSLCLSSDRPGVAVHSDDSQFAESVTKHFDAAQSNAAERLVALKEELRAADTEKFWKRLMEGMTSICNAQYAFVAKRILPDDEDSAVEMPPIGEPGSCLLGIAFYYNDGHQIKGMQRDFKYFACGAPCAHMKHDKVFLIPEKLGSFIQDNPVQLPFSAEAYLGVPLFSEGKCFAHFGMMWSEEGLQRRDLSWSYLEMILHSLEEMVLQRILAGDGFARREPQPAGIEIHNNAPAKQNPPGKSPRVIPHQDTVFTSQPLKPYARSLSHELRTPMQGVVGMLDVMHATVQEALESKQSAKACRLFQGLKENIEIVQDSARRAVTAAENVVHAYDLNMQVPETPKKELEDEILGGPVPSQAGTYDSLPNILIEGSNISVNPYKRRRSSPVEWSFGPPPKHRSPRVPPRRELSPRSEEVKNAVHESDKIVHAAPERQMKEVVVNAVAQRPSLAARRSASRIILEGANLLGPVLRHTKIRDLLRLVINESLHVGGRPDSVVGEATDLGEKIELRMRTSSGQASSKVIEWSVDPSVPESLLVDERDLAKLISCVFLNAVKFTESGRITVAAMLSASETHHVLIKICDTGTGIPKDFLPNLFKPFAREDDSTTRSKDGLGLGLLVAKGLSKKMGGDLKCVRSSTSGPDRGSEFEINVPVDPADSPSRPTTPSKQTPTPPQCSFRRGSSSSQKSAKTGGDAVSPLQAPASRRNSQVSQQFSPNPTEAGTSQMPFRLSCTPRCGPVMMNGDVHDRALAEKYPLTFLVAEDNKINRRILVSMLEKLGYHDVYEAYDGREAVRIMHEILLSHSPMPSPVTTPARDGRDNSPEKSLLPGGRDQTKKLKPVDVVLMDLWMPEMDGYEATTRIFELVDEHHNRLSNPNSGSDQNGQQRQRRASFSKDFSDDSSSPSSLPLSPTVLAVSADVTDEALGRACKVGMEGYMTKPYKLSDLQRLIVNLCGGKENLRGRSREKMQPNGTSKSS